MNSPYTYNLHNFLTNNYCMIVQVMNRFVFHTGMIRLNYLNHINHPDIGDSIPLVVVVMDFGMISEDIPASNNRIRRTVDEIMIRNERVRTGDRALTKHSHVWHW